MRYVTRQLGKHPGFALIALLTLALGIGANVAIFSAINTLFFRPLPFREPARLVRIWGAFPDRGLDQANLSYPRFECLRDQMSVFTDLSAQSFTGFTITGRGEPSQEQAARVSANFFTTLGVQPQLGRAFLPDEDKAGGANVVLITDEYWQKHYNRDPGVIGRGLTLDNRAYTIIGVLPPSYRFPYGGTPLWTTRPFEQEGLPYELRQRGSGYLLVTGRLKPGVTLAQVDEQLKIVGARYGAANPEKVDSSAGIFARFFQDDLVGNQRPTFFVLLAAVGVVLLIACANVANLFLVRLTARRKEIAVRAALGATRAGIIRLFLTESTLLAVIAGALGSLLALWAVGTLSSVAADLLPRAREITIDVPVLGFALALSALTGILMGFVPSWQASHADVNETLKDATRGNTGGRAASRLRSVLFVGEVALSLVLLIGAGLLLRSFVRLQHVSPGFQPGNIVTFNVQLSPGQYPDTARQTAFFRQLSERLAALPGVTAASGINNLPVVAGGNTRSPFALWGQAVPPMDERRLAVRSNPIPGYFAALGIPLKAGRDFTWRDAEGQPDVVIISESTARRLFPNGENPVGRRLITGINSAQREIVGVVGDIRAESLSTVPGDTMYYPTAQLGDSFLSFVVRTTRPAGALREEIKAAVHALDPGIPLDEIQPLANLLTQSISDRRLVMGLVSVFALLALLLAGLGIYGVISYSVSQRTGEIGVRMALGASPGLIVGLVLREGLKLTLLGLGAGLLVSYGLTRLLASQLYEVSTTDPLIYAGVSAFLATVGFLACWIPARRATKVDPLTALRAV
ncbi:MAG: ABC transporter permease [Opitutae bacterium]|nr:ABC transporter permease [Opitutae bacterium]